MAFAIQYDKLYKKTPDITGRGISYNSTTHTVASSLSSPTQAQIRLNDTTVYTQSTTGDFSYTFTYSSGNLDIGMDSAYATFSASTLGLSSGTSYKISGTVATGISITKLALVQSSAPMYKFDDLYNSMATYSEASNVGGKSITVDSSHQITSPSSLSGLYDYQCITKNKCSILRCNVDQSTITYSDTQLVRFYDLSRQTTTGYSFGTTGSYLQMTATSEDGESTTSSQTEIYGDISDVLNDTKINNF